MVQQHWRKSRHVNVSQFEREKTAPLNLLFFKYKLQTKSWWLRVGIDRGKGFSTEKNPNLQPDMQRDFPDHPGDAHFVPKVCHRSPLDPSRERGDPKPTAGGSLCGERAAQRLCQGTFPPCPGWAEFKPLCGAAQRHLREEVS